MKYEVEYAGIKASSYGIYATERPAVPAPERDIGEVEIPGRDGCYHIDKGRYKAIPLPIEFNYLGTELDWAKKWRTIKKWLSAKDSHLLFSDDPDFYYHVYYVSLSENKRAADRIGTFTATFHCAPYMYVNGSDTLQTKEFTRMAIVTHSGAHLLTRSGARIMAKNMYCTINNPYELCKPIYKITGNGSCRIVINGTALRAQVTKSLTIDTEREITLNASGKNASNSISGKYTDLCLKPGNNRIEIDDRFTMQIAPYWRTL